MKWFFILFIAFSSNAQDIEYFPEVEASFVGGWVAYSEFLKDNLENPLTPNDERCSVFISFIVDTEGKISNVKIERGCTELLNSEALSVVEKMPIFIPAKTKGEKVNSMFRLIIAFEVPSKREWRKKIKK